MAMRLLKALKRSGFWLRERRNRLWVTPALASVVAVLRALAAAWVSRVVPEDTLPDIDRDTVQSLLTIVASSMLAVTTFSLSIMVSAFASAANGATPRATELVMGDEGTRSAIAMFLSAFIYAVVARVALGMGYYGGAGRFVLFLGTMGVLVMLLVTLVNWVKTLSTLGRMSNTLNKIEQAAEKALRTHWRAPLLGAGPAPAVDAAPCGRPVYARQVAYVRRIDLAALQDWAEANEARVHVRVRPGSFVDPGTELAWVELGIAQDQVVSATGGDEAAHRGDRRSASDPDGESLRNVHDAFYLGAERSFDQDPRFGVIVLSEAAQRALSSAVNDPGTAIDAMNRMTRLLIETQQDEQSLPHLPAVARLHTRVTLVPLDESALVFDGFDPIVRDAAGVVQVLVRQQKLLAMIARSSRAGTVARAARDMAARALARADATGALPANERDALRAVHDQLFN